jgi:hypothetical protein
MNCMICQHEWCWYCGMEFNSRLHMWMLPLCGTLGEIQNIPCIKKTCPWFSIVMEVSIFFLFPVYYVLLILLFCVLCIFGSMESIHRKCRYKNRCLFYSVIFPLALLLSTIFFLVLWSLVMVVALIPTYIFYLILTAKRFFVWYPHCFASLKLKEAE